MSRLITNWTPSEKTFEHRNAIHTVAMEKAARDRHLFASQGPAEAVDLSHPEYVSSVLCRVGLDELRMTRDTDMWFYV